MYHPKKGVHWATSDNEIDFLESDELDADEQPSGCDELYAAVALNDSALVKKLLAEGHDINNVGLTALPPLFDAVNRFHSGIVDRLLKLGADPNLKCGAIADRLLKLAGDPNLSCGTTRTVLEHAKNLRAMISDEFAATASLVLRPKVKQINKIIKLLEAAGAK